VGPPRAPTQRAALPPPSKPTEQVDTLQKALQSQFRSRTPKDVQSYRRPVDNELFRHEYELNQLERRIDPEGLREEIAGLEDSLSRFPKATLQPKWRRSLESLRKRLGAYEQKASTMTSRIEELRRFQAELDVRGR
jgi:chromosome segregation ATPase